MTNLNLYRAHIFFVSAIQEARKLSIQRCIQSLVHACQCRDANCRLPSCQKMKRVVMHTKNCKRKTNGGCPICKQLIALCCYHAKHCQETKCLVPFCSNIKHKIKQQQLQQRLQQAQLLRSVESLTFCVYIIALMQIIFYCPSIFIKQRIVEYLN